MTTPTPRARDGGITFDATGERLRPGMDAGAVGGLRAAKGARVHFGSAGTRVEVPRSSIEGSPFDATVVFEGTALARVELVMALASDGRSWADWSLGTEMARKREHEAWAGRVFGAALSPRPLALDRSGRPIFPEPLTWEHPRHAVFGWGEVVSAYDSKAGMAVLAVRYGPVPPLERA